MSNDAITGYDTTFSVRAGPDTETYTELAYVTSLTPPSDSVDVIDVTHMKSPGSKREKKPGLTDPGQCSMELLFVPASATTAFILAWRLSREVRECKIDYPDGTTWEFTGFVAEFSPSAPFDDKMTAGLTIEVTGTTEVS